MGLSRGTERNEDDARSARGHMPEAAPPASARARFLDTIARWIDRTAIPSAPTRAERIGALEIRISLSVHLRPTRQGERYDEPLELPLATMQKKLRMILAICRQIASRTVH